MYKNCNPMLMIVGHYGTMYNLYEPMKINEVMHG